MLIMSEPKSDDSFPDNHVFLDEYSIPYRLNLTRN